MRLPPYGLAGRALQVREDLTVVAAERKGQQQIGPLSPGSEEGLAMPPLPNLLVVSRKQDLGHKQTAKIRGPRVLRKVQQPPAAHSRVLLGRREGILCPRLLVA